MWSIWLSIEQRDMKFSQISQMTDDQNSIHSSVGLLNRAQDYCTRKTNQVFDVTKHGRGLGLAGWFATGIRRIHWLINCYRPDFGKI